MKGRNWNHGTARQREVTIFKSPSLDAPVMSIAHDDEGRLLSVTLSIQEVDYTFTNVYCPNGKIERRTFFKDIVEPTLARSRHFVASDFNTILGASKGRLSGIVSHT